MPHAPTIRSASEGRTIGIVGDVYRFLATGDETGGKYAMFEALVPPGGGPPPHVHSREEESFYVLEGEITFEVNGESIVAPAGTFANMPIGSLHSFRNATLAPARMIVSVAPAGLEQMFLEIGQTLAPGEAARLPTADDIAQLLAAAPRYGVEIRGPQP